MATFAGGPEAAGTDCTSEHEVPEFVNSDFTVASGGDGACRYRDKISEPGGGGFQANAVADKQDKFWSSCVDSAGKCLYFIDRS